MANTVLTLGGITRKGLALFLNSNAFLQSISRMYDSSFAVPGAKIGATLNVRLPSDPITGNGATVTPQSITEKVVPIVVNQQFNVTLGFGSAELALSVDDFAERFLETSMNNLAGQVASYIMGLAEGVCNVIHNTTTGNVTIAPTANTWLLAGAVLDKVSAPRGNRTAILSPGTSVATVSSMLGLFNPQNDISKQFKVGTMGASRGTLGIDDWRMDQTVINHTTAAYSTLGTATSVNAAGNIVTTSTLAGPLNAGDIITFQNVNAVNRVTKAGTGVLMQFVVTAAVASGATSIPIYPALIPPSGGLPVQYQTVDSALVSGAAIASPINAGEIYSKNLVFLKDAFTLVTADLYLPTSGVVAAARATYDGVSMRSITDHITLTDQRITRMDILCGAALLRPDWAVVVCAPVT